MYQVYYRKYRPQSFAELVGQNHIVRTLQNAVIYDKLAHAYIFCGPRGTGKTSLARLFAKSINCTNVQDGLSCNVCENCLLLQNQDHPDIIEIDAASNNGVDEIRTLVERVKYAPLKGKYKVYIIDEVHMMTSGAFNALLKTLEEPPSHVIFILATTESHKILPTIISRCQRYDFYKVNTNESSKRMKLILEAENIEFELAALNQISIISDGGLRDALGLLEQVVLYNNAKVTLNAVNEVCGMVSDEDKVNLLMSLLSDSPKDLVEELYNIHQKSLSDSMLINELLSLLKDTLVYMQLNDSSYAVHQEHYLQLIASRFNTKQIIDLMDELLNVQKQSVRSSQLGLLLEVTLYNINQQFNISNNYGNSSDAEHKEIQKIAEQNQMVFESENANEQQNSQNIDVAAPVLDDKPTQPIVESLGGHDAILLDSQEDPNLADDELLECNLDNSDDDDSQIEVVETNEDGDNLNVYKLESLPEQPEFRTNVLDFIEEHKVNTNDVLNVLVQAERENLKQAQIKWENTSLYISHQSLSRIATVLCDAVPVAACNEAVVITFESQTQANYVNAPKQAQVIEQFLQEILGCKTVCFALSTDHWIDCKNEYMKLRQVGKLPKAKPIEFKTYETEESLTSPGLEFVKRHFENEIIEEEN